MRRRTSSPSPTAVQAAAQRDRENPQQRPDAEERSILLACLLLTLHIGYAISSWIQTHLRRVRSVLSLGVVVSARLVLGGFVNVMRRLVGLKPITDTRRLNQSDFSRIPKHLAFAFAPKHLSSHGQDESSESDLQTTQSADAIDAKSVAQLILHCMELAIPELTLFDDEDVLCSHWDSIASSIVNAQSSSLRDNTILVLQGEPMSSVETRVILLYRGMSESISVASLLPPDECTDDLSPDTVASTSWRARVQAYVLRRKGDTRRSNAASTPPSVHLISLLGPRQSEQAIIDAALSIADDEVASSVHAAAGDRHSLRESLQSRVMPLPVSEPDLLLVASRGSEHRRALFGFPAWLLRITEIFYVQSLHELATGEALADRLTEFGRTVQRGGT